MGKYRFNIHHLYSGPAALDEVQKSRGILCFGVLIDQVSAVSELYPEAGVSKSSNTSNFLQGFSGTRKLLQND
jgi:hypothetical protein